MMNTNGRILCIALFVSMMSIGVLALATAVDDTAITAEDSPVTISVLANDTTAGSVITAEDSPVTISVLANDTTAGSVTLSVTSVPSFGTAVVNPDNTITYEPIANFHGTDTFTYQVVDSGGTSTAQVAVTVASVNDAPVLVDNLFATEADTPITITLHTGNRPRT